MRISDWSSDVCSSDLMQALADVVEGLPQRRTLEYVIAATGDLDAELRAVVDQVNRAGLHIDAVAIYPAPDLQSTPPGSAWPACPPLADVYAAARRAFPGLPLGGGMFGYFTELNRKRPPLDALDFLSHATCPIVHAADDLSVMQSLEAIRSEEHTSELQSLMRISYAVFCLKKKNKDTNTANEDRDVSKLTL